MYYRLKSEIIFRGYNLKEFAKECGFTYSTFLRKIKQEGKNTDFTLDECFYIKKTLKTNMPLEELFAWEERDE